MNLTWINQGLDWKANVVLNKTAAGNWSLKAYSNNHAPVVTDVNGSYTANGLTGGGDIALAAASWTGSTTAGVATYDYVAVTWTFAAYAGGTTIYGIALKNAAGDVIAAGLLDVAFAVPPGGGTLTINLEHKEEQCP